jgi:hypothetical protein
MSRARIRYAEEPNGVILTYYLPDARLEPTAGVWCLAGGVAVGIGLATALAAAGVTIPFRSVLVAVTVVVAAALYISGYWRALRTRYVQIAFDHARAVITVHRAYAGQRPVDYALEDVAAFRLVDRSTRWQIGCALLMTQRSTSRPAILVAVHRSCEDERSALPHFVDRLEAQLEANPYAQDDLPPLPMRAALPVPARRWHHDEPAYPDFPDDGYDDQQPAE